MMRLGVDDPTPAPFDKNPGSEQSQHRCIITRMTPLLSLAIAILTCAWVKLQVSEPPQEELREPGAEHGPLHLVLPLLQGQVPKALQKVGFERRGLPPVITLHEFQRFSPIGLDNNNDNDNSKNNSKNNSRNNNNNDKTGVWQNFRNFFREY